MRGVAFVTAVTLAAEVGDFGRLGNPRQLMAYFGLVPSEHSSGPKARRGGTAKAGSHEARHVLIEGAWTYRLPARVSPKLQARLEGLPKEVRVQVGPVLPRLGYVGTIPRKPPRGFAGSAARRCFF